MSLDLYITSKTPIRKRGTGVYVRENGQTVELKTMEEVRSHFPDADLSHISVHEYEDGDFWHGNITHNMNEMASEVPIEGVELTLYDLLWRPDEHGFATAGSRSSPCAASCPWPRSPAGADWSCTGRTCPSG